MMHTTHTPTPQGFADAHEHRIWSELMKLPRTMLRAMCRERQETGGMYADERMRLPRGITVDTASLDDMARALAGCLARRGFMR